MREIAIIVGVSFDPQQMKTKKKYLSYLGGVLFLSLPSFSLSSSFASLPLRSVMSEEEVNEVVKGSGPKC